jgi:hypothetical protein
MIKTGPKRGKFRAVLGHLVWTSDLASSHACIQSKGIVTILKTDVGLHKSQGVYIKSLPEEVEAVESILIAAINSGLIKESESQGLEKEYARLQKLLSLALNSGATKAEAALAAAKAERSIEKLLDLSNGKEKI